MTIKESIIEELKLHDGMSDKELRIKFNKTNQPINIACRDLESKGIIKRISDSGNIIRNYICLDKIAKVEKSIENTSNNNLQEERIKELLQQWLSDKGYDCNIAWGNKKGADIEAIRTDSKWIIEVKGCGSRPEMRNNYFIMILGEELQRMNDSKAKYSIALPNMEKYKRLWSELPELAKKRTGITCLFVSHNGEIEEEY